VSEWAIGADGRPLVDPMRTPRPGDDVDDLDDAPIERLSTHMPRRPDWRCVVDGREWPCVPYRMYMLTAWTLVPRALTMTSYFLQACEDLPNAPAGELSLRMLGWVRDVP
jgi:hypothetical protein